jgi:hypothetical protein
MKLDGEIPSFSTSNVPVLLYRMAPAPKNPEWLFSSPSYVVMPEKLVHQLAIFIVILHYHFILLFFFDVIHPDFKDDLSRYD